MKESDNTGKATARLAESGRQFSIAELQGADPFTGVLPESAAEQLQNGFRALEETLKAHDFTPDEVGRVTVFTPDRSYRPLIDGPWLATFRGDNRPARRTTHFALPGGEFVELLVARVRSAKRITVEIEGV
jgi:enamine deaminase RidA (YjgF/YER057c/UK114 family)